MSTSITRVIYPAAQGNGTGYISGTALAVSTSTVSASTYNYQPPASVNLVYFDVQLAAVRARWDGTAPTASTGHYLPINTQWYWDASRWSNAKFIRDTSATVDAVIFSSPMSSGA